MHRAHMKLAALAVASALVPSAALAASSATVGVVIDETGSADVYGLSQLQGLLLGADRVNSGGRVRLTLDIQDAASQKTQAVNLFQRFTTSGVSAIIGPTLSSEAFAADPIAVRAGVPVLAISNTANGITAQGPCVFRDSLSEAQIVPNVIDEIVKRYKVKTAAIIYGNDDQFTKTDYDVFKKVLDDAHIRIVDTETFAKGDVDFSAQLTKIKAANPDLLVAGALAEEAAHIMSDAQKLGLSAHIVGGNGFNSPKLISLSGNAAESAIVGAAWSVGAGTPGNADFVRAFRVRYKKDPDQFSAQAYAGVQILAAAVGAAKSSSAADVCGALQRLRPIQTVLGKFSFDGNRDANSQRVILTVHNGKFVGF